MNPPELSPHSLPRAHPEPILIQHEHTPKAGAKA